MSRVQFLVQGSASAPYAVTFEKSGNNLNAFCTCPAGDNGQACKHRVLILKGVVDGIVSGNANDVAVIREWLIGTEVERTLGAVGTAEAEVSQAQANLKAAKKELSRSLRS